MFKLANVTMPTISARCVESTFLEQKIVIWLRAVNYCSSNLRECYRGGDLQSVSQGVRRVSGWIVSPQFGPISMRRKWIFSDLLCLETSFCFDNQTEWYSWDPSKLSPELCFSSLPKLDAHTCRCTWMSFLAAWVWFCWVCPNSELSVTFWGAVEDDEEDKQWQWHQNKWLSPATVPVCFWFQHSENFSCHLNS